jgi:hypothetical protein
MVALIKLTGLAIAAVVLCGLNADFTFSFFNSVKRGEEIDACI